MTLLGAFEFTDPARPARFAILTVLAVGADTARGGAIAAPVVGLYGGGQGEGEDGQSRQSGDGRYATGELHIVSFCCSKCSRFMC